MSELNSQTLEYLKKLCRMTCSEEEDLDVQHSLNRILDYIEQLNEIDTTNVEPCNYVLRSMLKNLMREDIAENVFSRDAFLANAPDQIGGMIRTPPVLKDL
jgi:aspartyl-tRNA(Asn)/glutamyl-tRNA(Gln) amidotransferase subunit C